MGQGRDRAVAPFMLCGGCKFARRSTGTYVGKITYHARMRLVPRSAPANDGMRRAATSVGYVFIGLSMVWLSACATPEHELWEIAQYECRGRGGVIEVDVEKGLCFCLDGTVCKVR